MKTKYSFANKLIAFFFFILGCSSANAQCDWEAIGPDDDMFFIQDSSSLYLPSIASDNNGVQYVAFCDGAHQTKISVKRYVNDHWTFVGTPGFSAAKADHVKIATDNLNRVYVAYQDYANNKRLTVQFYNGFSWSVLGVAGMGNDTVRDMALAVDKTTNHPFVYFTDSIDISTVMEFDGSSWNVVGSTNFAALQMYQGQISSINGTPYLSYLTYTPGQLNVLNFDGAAWVPAGNFSSSFTNAGWHSAVAFDNNNLPHISFQDYSAGSQPSVMYLSGNTWDYLGTPGIVPYSTWYNVLAFDQNNNAYLSYTKATGAAAEIAKYNGTTWSLVSSYITPGNTYIPNQYAYYRGMSIDPVTDDLYLLYTESTASPLMGWKDFGVMKYDGIRATLTGSNSISGTITNTGSASAYFDFDKFGTPYVVYSDSTNSDKISVKKYENNSWVYVGTPGFNTGYTEWGKIAFDTTGIPYVAFRQDNSDIYVMKFDGNSWNYVGAVITNTYDIALAINPLTNQPHIFYCDVNNSLRGNVKKFNGSAWVSEGPANFTVGSAAYCNIKFDNLGNQYTAYSDNGLGVKSIVKKFNGTTWVTVGSGTISAAQAHQTKLKIDSQNNLYIVYIDQTNSYRALCHKFNGTSWQMLGSFISAGYTGDVDVATDNSGNVFVYYNEQYLNYYPGTVRRFFNNTWIPAGRQYISNASCKTNQIQINPVTGLPFIGAITVPGTLTSTLSRGFFLKSLPCNFSAALMGQVAYDANSNCANNPGEQVLNNQSVQLTQGLNTDLAFTDYSGNYYFTEAAPGAYTIGMGNLSNGYNIQCAGSQPHATNIVANSLTTEDFSIACTPSFDIIANSFTPIGNWWPGQTVRIWSNVNIQRTVCNGPETPGEIRLIFPPCLDYLADTTLPLQPDSVSFSVNGDTLWYYIPDVYNPSPYLLNSIITRAAICTTATANDSLCIELSVSAANDNNLANNTYIRCVRVATSYDPNFKEVTPKGLETEGFIPATTGEMLYTIHFQNTGTAPAVNISISDTISTNLDLSTFEIIASSHYMHGNSLTNGIMTFNFPNIMLPDSSVDMLNSMGYVTYKVNLKPLLAPLTEIENTAYIYFDYNAPIITNTTLNTIEVPVSISAITNQEFMLFPNPAHSTITVRSTTDINSIRISNSTGQLVFQKQSLKTRETNINLQELCSGIYFIELITVDKSGVIKFVKN